jgi:hypothetical protein
VSATAELTPLEMNPDIRFQWTAALRSGDYPQGTCALYNGNGYCCLGVLCELARKAGVVELTRNEKTGEWFYDGHAQLPPQSVRDWAGLDETREVAIRRFDSDDDVSWPSSDALVSLNDDDLASFAQIADAIDGKQPEGTS